MKIVDFKSFIRIVTELEKNHPLWFALEREDPVDEIEISRFENRTGYKLPFQFKQFISKYGSGYFGFLQIYSIKNGEFDLLKSYRDNTQFHDKFLPISENGCGDFYGFKIEGQKCSDQIYFADHNNDYEIKPTNHPEFLNFLLSVGLDENSNLESAPGI